MMTDREPLWMRLYHPLTFVGFTLAVLAAGCALILCDCAPEPRYAEPERCMEHDCLEQRLDAGVVATRDAAVMDADYMRGGP